MIILDIVHSLVEYSTQLIASGGIFFGFLLVLLESAIPALPLGVFVALNVNAFGFFGGLGISWLATCIGCFLSYLLFFYLSNQVLYRFLSAKVVAKIERATEKFRKISFPNLVLLIALPFTPAFLINIICGVAAISKKKFLVAIMIGKVFMLIFWGYISKSLIESVTDINTIIIVSLMLVVAYFISKFVSKKANIE